MLDVSNVYIVAKNVDRLIKDRLIRPTILAYPLAFVDTGDCSLLTLVLYFTDLSKDYVTMFQYPLMNFVIFKTLQLFVMYI